MEVLKIKSTHQESQGDYVLINAADFDEKIHEMFDGEAPKAPKAPEKMTVKELQAALTEKGIAFESDANKAALIALLKAGE